MRLFARSGRPPPSKRHLAVISAAVVLITVVTAGLTIWDLRRDAITTYEQEINNLGVAFAEQTSRTLRAVDLVLDQAKEHMLSPRPQAPEDFDRLSATREIHNFLIDRLKDLPQADALSVIAANGRLLNSTRQWPVPEMDLSDRDFIEHFHLHNEPASFFSEPVKNRSSGNWTVYVIRRISGDNGEFLGALAAAIRSEYFEAFYKAITLQDSGSVMLLRRDGTIFARYPHTENVMGQKMTSQSPWYQLVLEGGGNYRSPGYIDGIVRVVSVHPLRDYPVVLDVTISEEAALAHWRRQLIFIAAGALCAGVGFLVLFRMLATQFRRIEESRESLEARTSELQQTADALREASGT
jgi:Cache domain